MTHPLIIATESRYKISLLTRLQIPFTAQAANIDESALPGESAAALSQRLAHHKALATARLFPNHWVLAADQTAATGTQFLEKPLTPDRARDQLKALSNAEATFYTSVCLAGPDLTLKHHTETVQVSVRALTDADITHYLVKEPALDCCGGFKIEGLGISLFNRVASNDPTALEGLPLIIVAQWLREAGFKIP